MIQNRIVHLTKLPNADTSLSVYLHLLRTVIMLLAISLILSSKLTIYAKPLFLLFALLFGLASLAIFFKKLGLKLSFPILNSFQRIHGKKTQNTHPLF